MDKHVILLYDSEENARRIQFEFLSMPLSLNKNAIYLTENESNIMIEKMNDFGIDTDYYISKDLLHVIQIPDLLENPEGAKIANEKFMSGLLTSLKPPYYVVGRSFPDLTKDGALSAEIEAEVMFHSNFSRFNGACLCSYKKDLLAQLPDDAKQQILHNHHTMIDISEQGTVVIEDSDMIK
ncbi:MAG: hypothetical protein EPO62_01940 [Candidatus Nitrosotenuis sp.]|nr:MAG: hypothetical protein EPO62_01940 [Candidatus Nitrosotenuis sp.]